jgi:hypothetical protein
LHGQVAAARARCEQQRQRHERRHPWPKCSHATSRKRRPVARERNGPPFVRPR